MEEYTKKFYRLAHHTEDVRRDKYRAIDLYVIGLRPTYIGIRTEDHTLERVVEEARLLERRHVRQGTISDPYLGSTSRLGVS